MINKKYTWVGMFLIIGIFLISFSSSYSSSSSRFTQPGLSSYRYLENQGIDIYPILDRDKCGMGQDFIIQVAPQGCTPSVIRSDLLEEQNVPVFCPLVATKINPLIDINSIDSISFGGGKYSDGVSGVGFHPARAAVASQRELLNSPVMENIGYAVVVLKKQANESAIPDYVEGVVNARLHYDIDEAFGIGKSSFYLPILSDYDWEENDNYKQYSFWNGKGYLRADAINENSARISVYKDFNTKLSSVDLIKGKATENPVYIPGYYCLAGFNLRLDDVENPSTTAKIDVDGEVYNIKKGEYFLDNKCRVLDIEIFGVNQEVSIFCQDDENPKKFVLSIIPKITLKIGDEEKTFNIGDKILESNNNENSLYLAGVYVKEGSWNSENLKVFLVEAPTNEAGDKLDDSTIRSFYNIIKLERNSGKGLDEIIKISIKSYISASNRLYNWIKDGEKMKDIEYGSSKDFFDKSIEVVGFSGPVDFSIEQEFQDNFNLAKQNYLDVLENFPNEESNEISISEKALYELIELAYETKQRKTMLKYCDEFHRLYSESEYSYKVDELCLSEAKLSNTEVSSSDVLINGKLKTLSFEGVYEPDYNDYGIEFSFDGVTHILGKEEIFYLPDNEGTLEISDLTPDYVVIKGTVKENSFSEVAFGENTYKVERGKSVVIGSGENTHTFALGKINLVQQAKVTLLPKIDYSETKTNFTFKIGIEKRAIQLSPDQIQSKINNLDKTINKMESITDKLGGSVKALKGACLATGVTLTVKNFIQNTKGKSTARQMVMRSDNGWYDICSLNVPEKYSSVDDCLRENSDEIDKDVDTLADIIEKQNEDIKKSETEVRKTIFGEKIVDDDKFMQDYSEKVTEELTNSNAIDSDQKKYLSYESWENNNYYKEDLRTLQLNNRILQSRDASERLRAIAQENFNNTLEDISENAEDFVKIQSATDKWSNNGFLIKNVNAFTSKDTKKIIYEGSIAKKDNNLGIEENTPIQLIIFNNREYILSLEKSENSNKYIITDVFESGRILESGRIKEEIMSSFVVEGFDSSTYENKFENPQVKYYETEPYKGWPGVVPFDLDEGWYAGVKQTLPVLGGIQTYDDSGRVMNFYLCNVGENGKEQFNNGIGDDFCQMINLGSNFDSQRISGLTDTQTKNLVERAVRAVEDAQREYKSGVTKVRISGAGVIPVGTPMTNVPDVQCQDFMSPKDCYILFNVCDPVICPTSRCNLGGTYNVDNVIQSGIIGSIALCLPNAKEKIWMPVCLSGLHAGMQGLMSVTKSYRDCLQESLDTGRTVGICDEIHSIYLCEFAWRQISPFSGILIPKLLELATGQGTRGGGEYMGIMSAWETAGNSMDYFINYYGENSFNSFKARSTQDVGGAICKNFVSMAYPSGGSFIDSLTEPDSPTQFFAKFDEIPFSTATVPAISQYKVFYHIYGGEDEGSYFKVYLKGSSGSSFYQGNPTVLVSSGYINRGEYATETKDFTAPSGYQELCVMVNAQEECGFKQVSTSFAADYVKESYVSELGKQKEITSEKECVNGVSTTSSLYQSGLNIQENLDEYANPDIGSYGISRICSTKNPGKGTDAFAGTEDGRWVQVGYCGDKNIKCWLDKDSVKNSLDMGFIENKTLKDFTNDYLQSIAEPGTYLTDSEYNEFISGEDGIEKTLNKIDKEPNNGFNDKDKLNSIISSIDSVYEKTLLSNQRAELMFFKARSYNLLTQIVYWNWVEDKIFNKAIEDILDEELPVSNNVPLKPEEDRIDYSGYSPSNFEEPLQRQIGENIIKIVQDRKENIAHKLNYQSVNELDSEIYNAGIATNFECLVLQVAMQESKLTHCEFIPDETNALYCDNNPKSVIGSGDGLSYGVMQINTKAHRSMVDDVYDFSKSVNYGVDLLVNNYNKEGKEYLCKNFGMGESVIYSGWNRSLRAYNGWNSPPNCDKGDSRYVDNVLSWRQYINRAFPDVCGQGEREGIAQLDDSAMTQEEIDGKFEDIKNSYYDGGKRTQTKLFDEEGVFLSDTEPYYYVDAYAETYSSGENDPYLKYNKIDSLIFPVIKDNFLVISGAKYTDMKYKLYLINPKNGNEYNKEKVSTTKDVYFELPKTLFSKNVVGDNIHYLIIAIVEDKDRKYFYPFNGKISFKGETSFKGGNYKDMIGDVYIRDSKSSYKADTIYKNSNSEYNLIINKKSAFSRIDLMQFNCEINSEKVNLYTKKNFFIQDKINLTNYFNKFEEDTDGSCPCEVIYYDNDYYDRESILLKFKIQEKRNDNTNEDSTTQSIDDSEDNEGLSSFEKSVVGYADSCSDCGDGLFNLCDEKECLAISKRLRDINPNYYCAFEEGNCRAFG